MIQDLGDFKIQGTGTIGSKGQIVIPKEVRDLMGLNTGDNLIFVTKQDKGLLVIKSDNLSCFLEQVQGYISYQKSKETK